jgi:hypothetical protein
MSAEIAVQTLKRYLPDSKHRIRLHDLITEERERAHRGVMHLGYKLGAPSPDAAEFRARLAGYESQLEILEAVLATGCYWDGDGTWASLWSGCIERLANPDTENESSSQFVVWKHLQLYPALRLLYAGGLAATAGKNYTTLFDLINSPRRRDGWQASLALFDVNAPTVFQDRNLFNEAVGSRHKVPGSERLFSDLREYIVPYVPDAHEYALLFDRFEYILAVQYAFMTSTEESGYRWGPVGRFGYRLVYPAGNGVEPLRAEIEEQGDQHPLLQAGFFGRKALIFKEAEEPVRKAAGRLW